MFALKSCPRCRGDLYKTLDDEITCIQCGHALKSEENREALVRLQPDRRRRVATTKAA